MDENFDFEAFDSAIDADDGYQTDGSEDTQDTEETIADDSTEETGDDTTGSETDDGSNADGEEPGEDNDGAEGAAQTQETFTLKVNKENRTVSREEMISLAQKGADYDRVKQAHERAVADLGTYKNANAPAVALYAELSELAAAGNTTVESMVDEFRINNMIKGGTPREVAVERLARQKVERENAALRGAQTGAKTEAQKLRDRADREIAEFQQTFPNVPITQELVNSLMEDVHGGMSLTQAYQKHQNDQLAQENRRLQQELEAERKNRANRGSSPGSMGDSGARKTKSEYDDFFAAFDR